MNSTLPITDRDQKPVENEGLPGSMQQVVLRDIDIDSQKTISCNTALYFCPSSSSFVHGPILLRYVITAAEQILADGERIDTVLNIRYTKLMHENIKIIVADETQSGFYSSTDFSVVGMLKTNYGRRLAFYCASLPGDRIDRTAGINRIAVEPLIPLRLRGSNDECMIFLNPNAMKKHANCDLDDRAMSLYVYFDLAMNILINFQNGFQKTKSWFLLAGEVKNITIFVDLRDILSNDAVIQVHRLNGVKTISRSGLTRITFAVTLAHSGSELSTMFATFFGTQSIDVITNLTKQNTQ
ncbi:MAG: hypothetical protein P9L99_07600 [Candidatus Lernaella stagnicola]|nr:hypothetical protein [Candidatus Lernaella stagnicola]